MKNKERIENLEKNVQEMSEKINQMNQSIQILIVSNNIHTKRINSIIDFEDQEEILKNVIDESLNEEIINVQKELSSYEKENQKLGWN